MNTFTKSNKETLDLGAMMEDSLDDIPEAPEFVIPPPGLYSLEIKEAKVETYQTKKEPEVDKQRMKIIYGISETVAISGNEPPVPDGSLISETFQGTREGLSYFKSKIKAIMNVSDLAGVSLKDMMESVKGASISARITIRKSPNPEGGEYENVTVKVIPPKE